MPPVIVAYIPVLHEGYRRLFERHPDAKELCIFGDEVIASHEHLVKDIRRLDPKLIQLSIAAWGRFEHVSILDAPCRERLRDTRTPLVVSDDDVSTEFVRNYFSHNPVDVDTIFLRWDKHTSIAPVQVSPDVEMSDAAFDQDMLNVAIEEGNKSRDWWRRIGAIAVKDGALLLRSHNHYVPSDYIAYDEGDPRSNFTSGVHFESSLALHAEAGLVAQAANKGISLAGADIYTDTFPCPPCAKQLAYAGIKRLFYRTGYNVLDGERVLRSQGVQIIFVNPVFDNSSVGRI